MNKKKFLLDSFINIISTALPLLVLQLITLPIVGSTLGSGNFGVVITTVSIFTVISFPLGNVLNNVRLLRDEKYKQKKLSGDYNYLLLGSSIFSSLMMLVVSILFIEKLEFYNLILLVLVVLISLTREYLLVSYRLNLNFKGIFTNNILLSIGYIIGTLLFIITRIWELIYLSGYLISVIYLVKTTPLLSEPVVKTKMFKDTFDKFKILYGSSLLNNVLNNADKIILLPLLGAKMVSIYYTASIFGKVISMFFNPINGVILSYLVKMKGIRQRYLLKGLMLMSLIGVLGYFLILFLSPLFFNLFYPSWAKESSELVNITAATAIISVFSSIFLPLNLRYNNLKWQIYISASNLIFFILTAFYMTSLYGLFGFTIAVLLSAAYRFVFQVLIYWCNPPKVS